VSSSLSREEPLLLLLPPLLSSSAGTHKSSLNGLGQLNLQMPKIANPQGVIIIHQVCVRGVQGDSALGCRRHT
jgi:hypothetical protein